MVISLSQVHKVHKTDCNSIRYSRIFALGHRTQKNFKKILKNVAYENLFLYLYGVINLKPMSALSRPNSKLTSGLLSLLFLIAAASCTSRVDREKEVLSSLLSREITIPDSLTILIQDTPIDNPLNDADYKIITYIDSAGCTPCRMKLPQWNSLINEFKLNGDVDVAFLMIINSDSGNELDSDIKRDLFFHPLCFDSKGAFESQNLLPAGDSYHTLLLDADNKVVCAGNPVINPKVRELYREIINKGKPETGLLCPNQVYALGILHPGDTITRMFRLSNGTDRPVTLQEFVPSCDCVVATPTSDSIKPGATSMVTVTLIADTVPGAFSRHVDVFYNEYENPERLLLHGFIIDN